MSWKNCTSCRKEIDFATTYWECSVSTCNRKRLGLFFCTVACWDAHLPDARHREAWAIEKRSPSKSESERQESQDSGTPKRVVATASGSSQPARRTVVSTSVDSDEDLPRDVLVVVSKLKKYVKAKSDMKTSETVIPVLSQELRRICDRAIRIAGESGRKTILDRDVRDALKD
jgi:histone H3/H4